MRLRQQRNAGGLESKQYVSAPARAETGYRRRQWRSDRYAVREGGLLQWNVAVNGVSEEVMRRNVGSWKERNAFAERSRGDPKPF